MYRLKVINLDRDITVILGENEDKQRILTLRLNLEKLLSEYAIAKYKFEIEKI